MLLAYYKRFTAFIVISLLAQVGSAEDVAAKPQQGGESFFPVNDGAALLKELKAIERGGDINAAGVPQSADRYTFAVPGKKPTIARELLPPGCARDLLNTHLLPIERDEQPV